ncbi:MAG: hypothetical protein GC192_15260 [Bacteroidetes bacterium]|nr:hypothetical protein [Bacteroidota bacterium]
MSNYNEIAKRSFKSKWRIYLFDKVINSKLEEINQIDFERYDLSNEPIKKYANEYWQEFKSHKINGIKISEIEEIISNYEEISLLKIQEFESEYTKGMFPRIFPQSDFEELTKKDVCGYCGITKSEIEELGIKGKLRKKNLRGWSLEIDRLEPNKEYSKENCVMSCYWCNNAKTDEFNENEFRAIGREIGIALKNRLKNKE